MNTVLTAILSAVRSHYHRDFILVVYFCLSLFINTSATLPLPEELQSGALATIDFIYNEKFKLAEEEVRHMIKKYPDHPAGYFFMAVVLDSWSALYQSNKKADEFYRYCDLAIEKGEILLATDGRDEWAKFFVAGADGYKGTFEARYEKWITAFRYGWKGVSVFIELEKANSSIVDINYGIGSYDYWRSAMIKVLWFMNKVDDKRQRAIERLLYSKKEGVFTKVTSASALVDILLNEKRFSDVIVIAEEMLKKYPNSTIFLLGKARSLFGLKRFSESSEVFRVILSKVESDPMDNHYTASLCHLWLARSEMESGNYAQAIAESNRVGYYDFEESIKKRLDKELSEAVEIRKMATSKLGK